MIALCEVPEGTACPQFEFSPTTYPALPPGGTSALHGEINTMPLTFPNRLSSALICPAQVQNIHACNAMNARNRKVSKVFISESLEEWDNLQFPNSLRFLIDKDDDYDERHGGGTKKTPVNPDG